MRRTADLNSAPMSGVAHVRGMFGVWAMHLRVRQFGQFVGVATHSPHDCRHRWATRAAQAGTPITDLRDAGGWANFDTSSRYVERARVANVGLRLTQPARQRHVEDAGEGRVAVAQQSHMIGPCDFMV